ncbi:MAG: DNA polymerase [Patescibacteria group bacterium]
MPTSDPKPKTKKKSDKKVVVLLDAHAILHRAYHALPDFASPTGEPTGALYGVVAMLLKIIEDFKPDAIVACFDLPEPTYRHDAFAAYKGTRSKTDDALIAQINRSRDIFKVFGIPIFEHPGFEADDMLGTIAHQMKREAEVQVVIASGDMDTMQCVDKKRVVVYTLKKGIKDTILYDEEAVKERFGFAPKLVADYKGLRGDTSDNIPGIVGIGEKTATELITQFGGIDDIYKKLKKDEAQFLSAGIKPRIVNLLKEGEEEARFSKMLATIRTDAPVTFTMPTTHWQEVADTDGILNLFSELGFRTLGARIKTLFALSADVSLSAEQMGVTALEIKRASVLLWLLDSERTDARYEDIVDYGRSYYETADWQTIVKRLEAEVEADAGLWSVFTTIEAPLMAVIEHINATGITLDVHYLKTLSVVMHAELETLEKRIHEYAGVVFNINSPKQMGEVLFDTMGLKPKNQKKTAGGQRSTKESELDKMKDLHPIIVDILRYRALQKLVSTYIDNLPELVSPDGRLRTTFVQTGAATGRMASQNPNLQNIPIRTEESKAIRKGFVASPGYTIVSIDYSQIELRMAAILSGDAKLVEIFTRGEDVHTGVAVRVFNVAPEAVTREMRRKAKVINFGILYGMGVNALRGNLGDGTSREEAQEFFNAYFNTFTTLAEYLEGTKEFARTHGYTETLFGRKRHFSGMRSSAPFIRAQAERMAINAPVQGTAADAMRVAMNNVYKYITIEEKTDDIRILLQVHDELLFEIKSELAKKEIPKLIALMEGVLAGYETRGVPIKADVAVGPNWAELIDQA